MNQQPPVSTTDLRAPEQRSGSEPSIDNQQLHTQFEELKTTTHGTSRAKGAVRIILRDYLPKPEIAEAMFNKFARGIRSSAHQNGNSGDGYPLLLKTGGLDGRAILQSYLDGSAALDIEDVKGILFAIRRECNRTQTGGVPVFQKLADLVSIAIFEIQQQRRIDTSTVQLKL